MPVPRSEPTRRRPPGARRAALLELLREHDGGLSVADLAPMAGLHPNTVRAHLEVLTRTGHVMRSTENRGTPGRPRELYAATGAPDGDRNYQLLAEMLAARLSELTDDPSAAAVEAGRRWSRRATSGSSAAGDVGVGVDVHVDVDLDERRVGVDEDVRDPDATPSPSPSPSPPDGHATPEGPDPTTSSGSAVAGSTSQASGPAAPEVDLSPEQRRDDLAPVMRVLRTTGFAPELSEDGASIRLRHCPFRELAEDRPDIVCGAHLGLIQGTLEQMGSDIAATRIVPFVQPDLCLAHLTP